MMVEASAKLRQLVAVKPAHFPAVDRLVGKRVAYDRRDTEGLGPGLGIRMVVVEENAVGV